MTPLSVPRFKAEAEAFGREMADYPTETIAKILSCNSQIAAKNKSRFLQFFEEIPGFPAILSYYGQAYKHLRADTLSEGDLDFSQQHLWITSFLYGLLRPLDAIKLYRMEGHVELPSGEGQNMFGFWKKRLTDVLIDAVKADDGLLVHLATEEFQHLFDWQRVMNEVRVIQPLFYVRQGTKLKMQAVWAKSCRGAMTRFIIQNRISQPEELSSFNYEGFVFQPTMGEADFPHFVRDMIV